MSIKKHINDIFAKYGVKLSAEETQAAEFKAEGKLADGTMIYTTGESFAQGSDIFTQNESGERAPLAAGDYALESGQMIVVGEDGKIVEVKEATAAEEDMSAEETTSLIESLVERVATLETKLSTAEADRDKAAAEAATFKSQFSAEKAKVIDLEKKAAAPSVTEDAGKFKATEEKKPEKHWSQMTIAERVKKGLSEMKSN